MLYHRIFYNSIYEYYARKSKFHDIPYNVILFFHARNMLYHRMIYIHIFLFHARTTVIHHMARSNLYVSRANNNDFPRNHGILTLCDHEYIALTLYSLYNHILCAHVYISVYRRNLRTYLFFLRADIVRYHYILYIAMGMIFHEDKA